MIYDTIYDTINLFMTNKYHKFMILLMIVSLTYNDPASFIVPESLLSPFPQSPAHPHPWKVQFC